MTKVEVYTEWMENLANDNSHGYAWGGWGPQDYDCGHAIITALEQAGIPVRSAYGASYTGDMKQALLKAGAKEVTAGVNLATGAGLRRGDILLNEKEHAAVYVGNGKLSHARSSEGNTIPGDQSGNEIRIQPYFNYPWDCILRFPETIDYDDDSGTGALEADGICGPKTWEAIAEMVAGMPMLQCITDADGKIAHMPSGYHVKMLQSFLNYFRIPVQPLEEDGDYGPLTAAAVKEFQRKC